LSPFNNTQEKKVESFISSLKVHLGGLVKKMKVVKASNHAANAKTIANFDINLIKTETNINSSTTVADPVAKRIKIEH
jgi:hypothetical protein